MISSVLVALALNGASTIRLSPEQIVTQLISDYKRETAYQLSGQTPPLRPRSKTVAATYAPSDLRWVEQLQGEIGIEIGSTENRFAVGQCTWLAYCARPDFPFDSRGGGRNDAKNWLDLAKQAGWPVGEFVPGQPKPLPQKGAILVHKAWPGNAFGHVSVVSKVHSSERLTVWDCNFAAPLDGKVRKRDITLDDYVAGYIYRQDASMLSGVWLLPSRTKAFGTKEVSQKSDGPYWVSVTQLDPDVPNHASVAIEILPDPERSLDLEVTVWPRQFKKVTVAKKATEQTRTGFVPISALPDRYLVVLIRPTRLLPADRPITLPLVYATVSVR